MRLVTLAHCTVTTTTPPPPREDAMNVVGGLWLCAKVFCVVSLLMLMSGIVETPHQLGYGATLSSAISAGYLNSVDDTIPAGSGTTLFVASMLSDARSNLGRDNATFNAYNLAMPALLTIDCPSGQTQWDTTGIPLHVLLQNGKRVFASSLTSAITISGILSSRSSITIRGGVFESSLTFFNLKTFLGVFQESVIHITSNQFTAACPTPYTSGLHKTFIIEAGKMTISSSGLFSFSENNVTILGVTLNGASWHWNVFGAISASSPIVISESSAINIDNNNITANGITSTGNKVLIWYVFATANADTPSTNNPLKISNNSTLSLSGNNILTSEITVVGEWNTFIFFSDGATSPITTFNNSAIIITNNNIQSLRTTVSIIRFLVALRLRSSALNVLNNSEVVVSNNVMEGSNISVSGPYIWNSELLSTHLNTPITIAHAASMTISGNVINMFELLGNGYKSKIVNVLGSLTLEGTLTASDNKIVVEGDDNQENEGTILTFRDVLSGSGGEILLKHNTLNCSESASYVVSTFNQGTFGVPAPEIIECGNIRNGTKCEYDNYNQEYSCGLGAVLFRRVFPCIPFNTSTSTSTPTITHSASNSASSPNASITTSSSHSQTLPQSASHTQKQTPSVEKTSTNTHKGTPSTTTSILPTLSMQLTHSTNTRTPTYSTASTISNQLTQSTYTKTPTSTLLATQSATRPRTLTLPPPVTSTQTPSPTPASPTTTISHSILSQSPSKRSSTQTHGSSSSTIGSSSTLRHTPSDLRTPSQPPACPSAGDHCPYAYSLFVGNTATTTSNVSSVKCSGGSGQFPIDVPFGVWSSSVQLTVSIPLRYELHGYVLHTNSPRCTPNRTGTTTDGTVSFTSQMMPPSTAIGSNRTWLLVKLSYTGPPSRSEWRTVVNVPLGQDCFSCAFDRQPNIPIAITLRAATPIPEAITTLASVAVGMGVIVPSALVRAGMMNAVLSMLLCSEFDPLAEVGFVNNPLDWAVGRPDLQYQRGSVYIVIIVMAVAAVALLCAMLVTKLRSKPGTRWSAVVDTLRMPSLPLVLMLLVSEMCVSSATSMIVYEESNAADIIVSLVAVLPIAVYMILYAQRAITTRHITVVAVATKDVRGTSKLVRVMKYALEPTHDITIPLPKPADGDNNDDNQEKHSTEVGERWLRRNFYFVAERRWAAYGALEVVGGTIANILEGIPLTTSNRKLCVARPAIILIITAVLLGVLLFKLPNAVRLQQWCSVLVVGGMLVTSGLATWNAVIPAQSLELAAGFIGGAVMAVSMLLSLVEMFVMAMTYIPSLGSIFSFRPRALQDLIDRSRTMYSRIGEGGVGLLTAPLIAIANVSQGASNKNSPSDMKQEVLGKHHSTASSSSAASAGPPPPAETTSSPKVYTAATTTTSGTRTNLSLTASLPPSPAMMPSLSAGRIGGGVFNLSDSNREDSNSIELESLEQYEVDRLVGLVGKKEARRLTTKNESDEYPQQQREEEDEIL